jgi:hypothetical protein
MSSRCQPVDGSVMRCPLMSSEARVGTVLESILRPAPEPEPNRSDLRTGPPSRSPPPNSGPSPCRPQSWLFLRSMPSQRPLPGRGPGRSGAVRAPRYEPRRDRNGTAGGSRIPRTLIHMHVATSLSPRPDLPRVVGQPARLAGGRACSADWGLPAEAPAAARRPEQPGRGERPLQWAQSPRPDGTESTGRESRYCK